MYTLTDTMSRYWKWTRQGEVASSTLGMDWVVVVLNVLGIGGVYADAWSHRVYGADQAVFSVYHVTFFSSVTVLALFLIYVWTHNVRQGYGLLEAFPRGHLLTFAGVVGFFIAGVVDQAGHWLFGFEVDLEALLSPSHVVLYIAGGLMVTGPVRAYNARRHRRQKDALTPVASEDAISSILPALFALGLLTSMVGFAAMIFLPISGPLFMTEDGKTTTVIVSQIAGISGVLLQTTLVMGVFLWMVKQYRLPFGSFTLVISLYALCSTILTLSPVLLPVWFGTGLAADLLYAWLRPAAGRRGEGVVFGLLVPAVMWGLFYGLLALFNVDGGLWWSGYIWVGSIVYASILGALLGLLVLSESHSVAPTLGGGV